MPSGNNSKNSVTNLMRLFKVQPNDQVVTRQDLTRDYNSRTSAISFNSHDNDDNEDDDGDSEINTINNYYTWNSSITNVSFHKERKEIISALHSTESAPILPSSSSSSSSPRPLASKSFTRSHRVQDIVAMCADERNSFSADEYHNNETVHADDGTPFEDGSRPVRSDVWKTATLRGPSAANTADDDSQAAEPGGRNGRTVGATSHRTPEREPSPTPRSSFMWQWTFGLFGKR